MDFMMSEERDGDFMMREERDGGTKMRTWKKAWEFVRRDSFRFYGIPSSSFSYLPDSLHISSRWLVRGTPSQKFPCFSLLTNYWQLERNGDSRIVDEYTFGQYQEYSKALFALKCHWDTWITESDFAAIAATGWVFLLLTVYYSMSLMRAD